MPQQVLQNLTSDIDLRAKNMFWAGILILILSFSISSYLYCDIKNSIDSQVEDIKNGGEHALLILIYLIFRILTLGGIVTALLIFGYNMIKASFDQSIRFSKRKHAALFLEFLHKEHADKVKEMSFDQLMAAFDTWNKTTESSFTSIKISNRNSFALALENLTMLLKDLKQSNNSPK